MLTQRRKWLGAAMEERLSDAERTALLAAADTMLKLVAPIAEKD